MQQQSSSECCGGECCGGEGRGLGCGIAVDEHVVGAGRGGQGVVDVARSRGVD